LVWREPLHSLHLPACPPKWQFFSSACYLNHQISAGQQRHSVWNLLGLRCQLWFGHSDYHVIHNLFSCSNLSYLSIVDCRIKSHTSQVGSNKGQQSMEAYKPCLQFLTA
jgi:hypothetical protein